VAAVAEAVAPEVAVVLVPLVLEVAVVIQP
jgi:hypothetical protein